MERKKRKKRLNIKEERQELREERRRAFSEEDIKGTEKEGVEGRGGETGESVEGGETDQE